MVFSYGQNMKRPQMTKDELVAYFFSFDGISLKCSDAFYRKNKYIQIFGSNYLILFILVFQL